MKKNILPQVVIFALIINMFFCYLIMEYTPYRIDQYKGTIISLGNDSMEVSIRETFRHKGRALVINLTPRHKEKFSIRGVIVSQEKFREKSWECNKWDDIITNGSEKALLKYLSSDDQYFVSRAAKIQLLTAMNEIYNSNHLVKED